MPTQLAGWSWRRLEPVGEGSTARVFRAEDAEGRIAALKVAREPAFGARLAGEAERLLWVDSPELARVLDAGFVPEGVRGAAAGAPYLALTWAEGAPLERASARLGAASRHALALAVARDVACALRELHASGASHGDVKPSNVVVESPHRGAWRARLVDLDLAGAADAERPRGGTPRYLAPEVFTGAPSDARARDLWALGVTLAEAASPEVARAAAPAEAARAVELPAELAPIVRALLAAAPGARPSAAWVVAQLTAASGPSDAERRRGAVQRAYLTVRRAELLRVVRFQPGEVRVGGAPGRWLAEALEVARRVARLRGRPRSEPAPSLVDLDALGRARWLVALAGAEASRWPPFASDDDAALAERLLRAVTQREPASLTLLELEDEAGPLRPAARPDAVGVALRLGAGHTDAALLAAGEALAARGEATESLVLALARAARLRAEPGRALALLGRLDSPAAEVEAAESLRRAGAPAEALARVEALAGRALDETTRSRRAALMARLALDAGDAERALELAAPAPATAATLEVRALAELAMGARAAATKSVALARSLAENDEERARVAAVTAALAHYSGDARSALDAGERAVEYAARAGAVLEEATYLTSVAAAAANLGEAGRALTAASRAIVLFEHLGRAREAARAALSRAAVYAALGAAVEARAAAYDAIARARAAGDDRCRAYAHLALADVAAADDPEGVEHARRAVALIDARDREDELWTGARLVARGAEAELDLARLDELGRGSDLAVDARLAWWEARARRALRRSPPERPDALLSELAGLAAARAPCTARGPALAAGAELAALAGDGELARRFAEGAAEAARELLARVPPEVASAARALPWVAAASRASEPVQLSSAQLGDIEALVRALARRDRLRPLLDRIVDALVLWTGVERGLLLLRAPGERLVPRAARNLARGDLAGAQLELSQSLAKRALALGEPVIAVDAAGELPEVHRSVHALRLRSVLAVPLIARGEALGVVYLDDRARRGAFGPRELAWVKLVGALAAVAIADARDQLLLARAARRARRAEARAALALARRETELDVAERELARARDARDTRFEYGAIIGRSEPLRAMLRVVDRVSVSEVPVLVIGESGSGKELVARAIHDNGPRAGRPFVSENCGALPESLLDSALFGHVRGAFTGASTPRAGLFETAHQGTLFLDELGEMSPALQAKLLRVLEDGVVHPVGSERPRRVDVRVIGATHRDLAEMAERGAFRRDLLYRLDVISIRIPPLRERPGDVALLVRHFVAKYAAGRRVRVATAALDLLAASPWPGNVRQLENELRRALVLADDEIRPEHLSPEVSGLGASGARARGLELRPHIDALEVRLVSEALARSAGNQTRAAELLGVSRFGLQKMMRRLGL